jgi:hypothetical protein
MWKDVGKLAEKHKMNHCFLSLRTGRRFEDIKKNREKKLCLVVDSDKPISLALQAAHEPAAQLSAG